MVQENPNSVNPSGNIPNTPNPNDGKGIPFEVAVDKGGLDRPFRGWVEDDSESGYSTYQEYLNNTDPPYKTSEEFRPEDIEIRQNDVHRFNPVYYPDRYNDTLEKEVERDARQCGGEDVSVDKTKNPEFHATGIVLDGNVSDFRKVRKHKGPVNLITPLTDNEGGMEVVITKGQIGELVGWDGLYKQWQFNYTLDMVATGSDTDDSGENQVVSEVLEEYQES